MPGDRGSCSADSGVRGSSDRESGGATSAGGNLSDSTTDGKGFIKEIHSYRATTTIWDDENYIIKT